MVYDIVIQDGRIVDGTGDPTYLSDLAIKNGKITKIKEGISDESTIVIDAKVSCDTIEDFNPNKNLR